jgi:hypothetical protein
MGYEVELELIVSVSQFGIGFVADVIRQSIDDWQVHPFLLPKEVYSMATQQTNARPTHELRLGRIRATIWADDTQIGVMT